jgi:Flp pilus assembly protein TadD
VQADAHAANHYLPPIFRGHAIGCERCHGPGELHVESRRAAAVEEAAAQIDHSIVNPRHLEHSLREAVCQQCHLEGEMRVLPRGRVYFDYRPGLPLDRFIVDFVRPPEQRLGNKFVGTVEQMYASRCFAKSTGAAKLGCISCHDPHAVPGQERRVQFYRQRCLACHADGTCSLPLQARLEKTQEDSCIVCHMPRRSGSVTHTAISDHSIPRHGDRDALAGQPGEWPRPEQVPLLPFASDLRNAGDMEQDRNLGVALVEAGKRHPLGKKTQILAERALPLLERAAAGDPHDSAAWEAKAGALVMLGRPEEALAACAAVLKNDPKRETTLFLAASLAKLLKRPGEVRGYAGRAVQLNPRLWNYRQLLAEAYAQEGDWTKAADACQQALKLEPANLAGRQLLIRCFLRQGDKARARAEMEACLALVPAAQRETLRSQISRAIDGGN